MKQITIMTQSKIDVIAEVTKILAGANVNIDNIVGEHYGSQAIVNVTVDNEDIALNALQKRLDWQVVSEDVVLIKIKDEIGALAKLSGRLAEKQVMIHSIRFVERHDGHALVAISVENPITGRSVLQDLLTTQA